MRVPFYNFILQFISIFVNIISGECLPRQTLRVQDFICQETQKDQAQGLVFLSLVQMKGLEPI